MPEPCGETDALPGVLDRGLALLRVGRHEVLVDREHRQREPAAEGGLLQRVQVGRRLVVHLDVEQLDAFETDARRLLDDLLDRVLLLLEVPVGVGGDREPDRPGGRRAVWAWSHGGTGEREGSERSKFEGVTA